MHSYDALTKTPENERLQTRLDEILSRELTPETINSYADRALADLVDFTTAVVAVYNGDAPNRKSLEDAAFAHFGLKPIDTTLDHVSTLAGDIHALDDVIANAHRIHDIIIPSAPVSDPIKAGSGNWREKKHIDRLKTILFVLEHDFGVNVHDPEELNLTPIFGEVTDMVRKESFYALEVPGLGRTIFVNDEEGNATYVFDMAVTAREGATTAILAGMKHAELQEFIKTHPGSGKRIVYSTHFVERIQDVLENPVTDNRSLLDRSSQYLRTVPKTPEDLDKTGLQLQEDRISLFGLAKHLGIGRVALETAAKHLGIQFRSGEKNHLEGFSAVDREMIRTYLESSRMLNNDPEPGEWNVHSLADELGLGHKTVANTVAKLGNKLGDPVPRKFSNGVRLAYTLEDRVKVIEQLSKGVLNSEPEPGEWNLASFAHELGVSPTTMKKVVTKLGDQITAPVPKKFMSKVTLTYKPEDKAKVIEYMQKHGRSEVRRKLGSMSMEDIKH